MSDEERPMSEGDILLWVLRSVMFPALPVAMGMQLMGFDGRYNWVIACVMAGGLIVGLYRLSRIKK